MSGNKLKMIACITMLIDHAGLLLYPNLLLLRYIGRMSMPLFAFLIAEGCLHTRSKLRYFLSIFSMAVLCQPVYIIEDISDGKLSSIYLNILFTFAGAMLVCFAYIKWSDAAKNNSKTSVLYFTLFLCTLVFSFICAVKLGEWVKLPIRFDYGIAGIILPLFGVIFTDKRRQLPTFTVGLVIFNLLLCAQTPYIWFSLLSLPFIAEYSGERGAKSLKMFFYLFYPLHFACLYIIKILFF
ncbi:MAG: hypothetical protein II370_04650 [Clostridia bacterium]|nr:hypothetical protein [Clostridia bacterium]